MRSWKAQKRLQSLRGKRPWSHYLLNIAAGLLAVVSMAWAVASCIPSSFQVRSMIWTWFFAAIGIVLGLTLYVLGERLAKRFLFIYLLTMAVALVAGVFR